MSKRLEQQHHILYSSLLITILAAAISVWGMLAVYRTLALTDSWEHFLGKQSLWMLAAWIIFFGLKNLKFEQFMRLSFIVTGIGALTMLFLPLFGMQVNGMSGWYTLGPLTVQPSELLKGFYILTLVKLLNLPHLTPLSRFTAALAVIAGFMFLLLIQPDFGTMTVYAAGGIGTLYFCRVKLKYLLTTASAAIPAGLLAIMLHPYMRNRLINFFDPSLDPGGGSWHLQQFCIAVARGEWFGVKGDMAVWSNSFLPLSHNDSIFAGMCEMLGFFGSLILLLLYAAWFYQMYSLSYWRHNPVRRMLIDSMACMLMMQCFIHILVNLGLLPPTGITLPLVSYGGSSAVGTMIMIAIIIIAGSKEKPVKALKTTPK
jgi:cell division protein FtsW (lipid II flippase)